jgi:two-component system, response regulator PdtaR
VKDEMAHSSPVILRVEDELLLRMDSAEMIENAGFEVVQAGNADEAKAILQARPAIHVVFTDIQMPGSMHGLKLARFVRDRWPPIKIVATSGRVRVGAQDAGGERLPVEALSRRPADRDAAGDDQRRCLIAACSGASAP